jgi:TRAP-type mannitol/chloroaromatic compound transport system substrate-binding protein
MKGFGEKKWMVGCIAMIAALVVLIANYIVIYKQNNVFKEEAVSNMNAEWYQLYHLSETIDKYYIKNNFKDSERFRLYVNQTCYHFTLAGRPNELNVNMRNLLTQAYDPLFADLYNEKDTLNKEKASEILKGINNDLMLISKGIIDMQDNKKEKLLEPASSEFLKVNTEVKNAADKYTKLVDDYFSKNQK